MEDQVKGCTNFEGVTNYYMYLLEVMLNLKQILKNDSNIKDTIMISLLKVARCQ